MKHFMLMATVGSFALATSVGVKAQSMGNMPGMTMPTPVAKKKPPAKQAPAKKPAVNGSAGKGKAPLAAEPAPAATPMNMGNMDMSPPANPTAPATDGDDGHGVAAMSGMTGMNGMGHMAMAAAYGSYSSTREASGTSWQPDSSEHEGLMIPAGNWMLMLHGHVDLIGDTQSGRRGDDKLFVAGMLMGMATRTAANGNTLQLRAMVSPDPLMGKRGYPLLLASGETANGVDRLIDRQHPHDLFMELSASYSVKLGSKSSVFVYGGLPGEPAFGPPAFMHRQSIEVSPEAPISHHWLDSTHITFGVVTAGAVFDQVKIEASGFNGREPDQHRYNIETGPLDSTALRISWNPTDRLWLQGSWANLKSPEQLEPGVNQRRWSASGIYTRPTARGWWATTLAWGRKTVRGQSEDAFALESSVKRDAWTVFGRAEYTENNELVESPTGNSKPYKVGKVSLGLLRDFPIATHLVFGVGGLYSLNFLPGALRNEYGGTSPHGAMGFVRLKIR